MLIYLYFYLFIVELSLTKRKALSWKDSIPKQLRLLFANNSLTLLTKNLFEVWRMFSWIQASYELMRSNYQTRRHSTRH